MISIFSVFDVLSQYISQILLRDANIHHIALYSQTSFASEAKT